MSALPGAAPAAPDRDAPLDEAGLLSFLVQCIGTDGTGRPVWPGPGEPPCRPDRLQRPETPALWRKHDYGGRGDAAVAREGYQASDSVLDRRGGRAVVVQLFDFGDGARRFGRFDKGAGDGGDLLAIVRGAAYGVLTEDGGAGLQWFVGPGCRTGDADGRLQSWLFFADDLRGDRWTERIARLNVARSADGCPARFGSALTRYRRLTVTVPVRVTDTGGRATDRDRAVDTALSEHFERETVSASAHMERFFFGRGLGKYRWEAWAEPDRSPHRAVVALAPGLAASGRCGPLAGSEPPGPGWVMTDCRTWTNLVRQARPWRASSFGWPDVAPFGGAE